MEHKMGQHIKDGFYYLLDEYLSNNNLHVMVDSRKNKDSLFDEFHEHYKIHERACKNGAQIYEELDPHKQAAVICLSVLDTKPLTGFNMGKPKIRIQYINEIMALELSRYHIRMSTKALLVYNNDFQLCDDDVLRRSFNDFPENIYDKGNYNLSFYYLLKQQLARGVIRSSYEYLSMSMLFFHYNLLLNEERMRAREEEQRKREASLQNSSRLG